MLSSTVLASTSALGLSRMQEIEAACKAIGVRLCGAGRGYVNAPRLAIKSYYWMSVQVCWQSSDAGVLVGESFADLLALVETRDALTEAHLLDFARVLWNAEDQARRHYRIGYQYYGTTCADQLRAHIEGTTTPDEEAEYDGERLRLRQAITKSYTAHTQAAAKLASTLDAERARIRNAWLEYDAANARSA